MAWIASLFSGIVQGGKLLFEWLQRHDLKRQGAQDWLEDAHERRKTTLAVLEDRRKIAGMLRRYRVRRRDPSERVRGSDDPPDPP